MNPMVALLVASVVVSAIGAVQQYQNAKAQGKLQKEQLEYDKKLQELNNEIQKREARAKARQQQAKLTTLAIAKGTQSSSIFEGQQFSIDTSLDSLLNAMGEGYTANIGKINTQEAIVELQQPSQLDLALGITGNALNAGTTYYAYSASRTPAPTSAFGNTTSTTNVNTSNLQLNWRQP